MRGYRTKLVADFRCVGDVCPDTCCKGWDMQVNKSVSDRYAKDAVLCDKFVASQDGSVIMRRDAASGFCTMLEKGWCGILKKHDDSMLGDACFFYPRSVRSFSSVPVMTAALSCPEAARIAISSDDAASFTSVETLRLPESIKEYAPAGMSVEDVLAINSSFQSIFISGENDFVEAASIMASVAQSLEHLPVASWKDAVPFYLRTGRDRLPEAENADADLFRLLQLLLLLKISYADMVKSERLDAVIMDMLKTMAIEPDWHSGSMKINDVAAARTAISKAFALAGDDIDLIVRRVMASQLALFGFPFAGHGEGLYKKALLLIIRGCIIKLALVCMSAQNDNRIDISSAVDVIQPLARFLDHQAEAQSKLWLAFAEESGWLRLQRLIGLLRQ